jgi:alpha-N-acetylglucosamine transferase
MVVIKPPTRDSDRQPVVVISDRLVYLPQLLLGYASCSLLFIFTLRSLQHSRSLVNMVSLPVSFPSSLSVSLRSRPMILSFAALLIVTIFIIWTPLPTECYPDSDGLVCKVADKAKNIIPRPHVRKWQPTELKDVKSKFAFATFLAGDKDTGIDDPFFVGVRLLTYQLLHANDTASRDRTIPLIVLVTKNVSADKRVRLQKDGAVVVEADWIDPKWVLTDNERWKDVMTKLRLWELTQFERICQLDGDTVLSKPLDGIFADPAVQSQITLQKPKETKSDEGTMPPTYSFAGFPEMKEKHGYPPTEENHDFPNMNYLNAGFFVFKPSLQMLSYYLSLLELPDRFSPILPEQNLFNYAHRPQGNMPWKSLKNTWNLHNAIPADVEGGVASVHSKWWDPLDAKMLPWLAERRWRMEGFFEAMDKLRDGA